MMLMFWVIIIMIVNVASLLCVRRCSLFFVLSHLLFFLIFNVYFLRERESEST